MDLFFSFQAGEFFHSAQSNAAAQHGELEVQHNAEGSIDSPLLLEQVIVFCFLFLILAKDFFPPLRMMLRDLVFVGNDNRPIETS